MCVLFIAGDYVPQSLSSMNSRILKMNAAYNMVDMQMPAGIETSLSHLHHFPDVGKPKCIMRVSGASPTTATTWLLFSSYSTYPRRCGCCRGTDAGCARGNTSTRGSRMGRRMGRRMGHRSIHGQDFLAVLRAVLFSGLRNCIAARHMVLQYMY